MRTKNNLKRISAFILSACMMSTYALAAPPAPQTDEAVYVNLDAYGTQKEIRVVKGVTRNGAESISDFGSYSEVNNLTSHDKPKMRADGVDFNLKNVENERFYYECIPNEKDTIQMPWNFDVSYKLNGKPYKQEELAGVNGLVEITIHAMPNPNADEYYKNNMALIIGTGIDMDSASTLEAEGAQIQSFGNYKFAVFFGLPSEENTYTIRIGAENFEFTGVYFLMTPITLSQLDLVDDFKQAKDTISGSRNDLYNGLNSMLGTMDSMKSGLNTMQSGINGINDVRKQLIASRENIDPSIDIALNQLETLAGDTNALIPTLETTQTDINAVHQNITGILGTLTGTQENISEYQNLLTDTRDNLTDIQNMLDELGEKNSKLSLKYVANDFSDLASNANSLSNSIDELNKSLGKLNELEKILGDLAQSGFLPPNLVSSIQELLSVINSVKFDTSIVLADLSLTCENLSHLFDNSQTLAKQLTDIQNIFDKYDGTAQNTAEIAKQATELLQNSLTDLDTMLSQTKELSDTLQTVNTNTNEAITQISKTTSTLSQTLGASKKALNDINQTLRSLRSKSDSATEQSLNGLIDVIGKATGSNSTDELQKATSSIHNTITNEVNEIENDSNILNIDSSLAVRSCTSSKNPSPSSLQFIARTDEISVDEMSEVREKLENEQDEGVLKRIGNIFIKIFDAVKSVF